LVAQGIDQAIRWHLPQWKFLDQIQPMPAKKNR
jgi:hypothetical protein